MNTIANIITLGDLIRLPKEMLKEICDDLGVHDDGAADLLAERIWEKMKEAPDVQEAVFERCGNRVFGGRTSSTWYHSVEGDLKGMKDLIVQNSKVNPFEEKHVPRELGTDPVLVSAAPLEGDGEYLLRYMYKTGVSRVLVGDTLERTARTAVTTVYVNEEKGILEIRSEPKAAAKIARNLGILTKTLVKMEQQTAPFGFSVEKIADLLGGELIDATGKPELLLEEFSRSQADSVLQILQALDLYFESEDIEELEENLTSARQSLGDEFSALPFTVLILSGMEKVGLGVKGRDLRGLPLWDTLKPHLQQQGGWIQFKVLEDGVYNQYTIRV